MALNRDKATYVGPADPLLKSLQAAGEIVGIRKAPANTRYYRNPDGGTDLVALTELIPAGYTALLVPSEPRFPPAAQ